MWTKEATLTDDKISPVKISTYIISIEITMTNLTGSWSGELFTRNRQSSLALLGNLSTINQPTNLSMHTWEKNRYWLALKGTYPTLDTVQHLFSCPNNPTNLNSIDLWQNPTLVAAFLSSQPSLTSLPSLQRAPPKPPIYQTATLDTKMDYE